MYNQKSLDVSQNDTSMMVLAPGLPTVQPVVDGGRVGLWLVENLRTDSPGGKVATRVEHAPPHVVSTR